MRFIKYTACFIAGAFFATLVLRLIDPIMPVKVEMLEGEQTALYKTVAHVDLHKNSAYQLICKNDAEDIAWYLYINEDERPGLGESVTFQRGETGTIVAKDVYGFNVQLDTPGVSFGYSGTAVLCDGRQVGIVSSYADNGYIRCVWQ